MTGVNVAAPSTSPENQYKTPDGYIGAGWSKAWKMGLWARLLDGDYAYRMLRTHLQYVPATGDAQASAGGTYPNLFDAHLPFQIDGNFGGQAGAIPSLISTPPLPSSRTRWEP